jgi:hypothetical protein
MAEQDKDTKYIICSRCKCKYINDDEHIKTDFGYTRLNEKYKTCVKCRMYKQDNRERILEQGREYAKKHYKENREYHLDKAKKYKQDNRDRINEYAREYQKKHYDKEKRQIKHKLYRETHLDKIKELRMQKVICNVCNSCISKYTLTRHQESKICKNKSIQLQPSKYNGILSRFGWFKGNYGQT